MQIQNFLNCLSANGIITGNSVQGIYSFQSGDQNLIYNLLYNTGSFYNTGIINTVNTPLISVGQSITTGGIFSGNNLFRLGYQTQNNFSILLDINYNACSKISMQDSIILSSNSLNNLNNNYQLTINDVNRLSFVSQNYNFTINQELTSHDFIYFSLSENQYVNFGIYNLYQNKFFSQQMDFGTSGLNSDIVYIGGQFSGNGFYGNINNAVLFNQPINQLSTLVECYYCTGIQTNNNIQNISIPQITGIYFSGIQTVIQTINTGSSIIQKENGQSVNVQFPNSVSSNIISGQLAIPLYSSTGININQFYYVFPTDTGIINSFNNFEYYFTSALQSGDALEIYTYSWPIPNVGLEINNLQWPNTNNNDIQLIGNGLGETNTIDYNVIRNQISGYTEEDILSYDILNTQQVVVFFTGCINSFLTGNTGFYPISGFDQLYNAPLYFPMIVNVTGLSGVATQNPNYPNFGYDIYLNGQKLISGYQYNITNLGNSGFNIAISGSDLMGNSETELYYNQTGWYLQRITPIYNSELSFIPQFPNFIYFLSGVTQTTSLLSGNFGFSEQIWINGLRQNKNIDYFVNFPCSSQTGCQLQNFNYQFANDSYSIFNFNFPPSGTTNFKGNFITGTNLTGIFTWNPINVGTYGSGNYLEVWGQIGNGSGYNLLNTFNTSSTGFQWILPLQHNNYYIKTRYVNYNIQGLFSSGFLLTY